MFSYPNDFPTRSIWTRQRNVIAPFWSDNDIRLEGVVRYTSYCNISNHPECNHNTDTYQPLLDVVNRYIQNDVVAEGNFFVGNWMLIAQWDHVHPSPHGNETQNMGFSNLELNKVCGLLNLQTFETLTLSYSRQTPIKLLWLPTSLILLHSSPTSAGRSNGVHQGQNRRLSLAIILRDSFFSTIAYQDTHLLVMMFHVQLVR